MVLGRCCTVWYRWIVDQLFCRADRRDARRGVSPNFCARTGVVDVDVYLFGNGGMGGHRFGLGHAALRNDGASAGANGRIDGGVVVGNRIAVGSPDVGHMVDLGCAIDFRTDFIFLYIGFIALQAAIDDPRRADKAGAVLALVGVVNVPIIYFSVIWWNSLHQGSSVSLTKSPSMAQTMFAGMILMALCFWMYSIAVALMRVRAIIIERERNAEWVRTEISMEKTNAVE